MGCCCKLQIIEDSPLIGNIRRRCNNRQQQRVEKLLGNDLVRSPKPLGNLRCGHSSEMQVAGDLPWQKKLSREKVHLDLPALTAAIIHHPVKS